MTVERRQRRRRRGVSGAVAAADLVLAIVVSVAVQ